MAADEGGFELGRAYVSVDPDAADFDEKLAEQIGSPVVMVRVVPDMGDFDAKVEEEAGHPVATVRVDADTGPAREQVDELVSSGLPKDAKFTVDADTSPARAGLSELDGAADDTRAHLDKIQEGAAAASRALAEVGGAGSEAAGELSPAGAEAQRTGEQFGEAAQGIRDFGDAAGGVVKDAAGVAGAVAGVDGALDAVPGSAAAAVGGLVAVKGELGTLRAELDGVEGAFGTAGTAMNDFSGAAGGVGEDAEVLAGKLSAPRDALRDVADNAGDASNALGDTGRAIGGLEGAAQPLADVGQGAEDMARGAEDAMGRFTELRGAVGVLEDDLSKLDQAYDYDSDAVDRLKLDLRSLRGEMDAVAAFDFKGVNTEEALTDWTRDVDNLGGAVDDLTGKLPAAKQELADLAQSLPSGDIHNAAGMYDNLGQDIGNAGIAAEAAQGRFAELRGTVENLGGELGQLDQAYNNDSEAVDALKLKLGALRGEMDVVSSFNFKGVDTEEALQDWTRDVGNLEGAVDDLAGKLPAAQQGLSDLANAVPSGDIHNDAKMYDNLGEDIGNVGSAAVGSAGQVEGLSKSAHDGTDVWQMFNKAMTAVITSPWTWATVGAIAVGGLTYVMTTGRTELQGYTDDLQKQYGAVNDNLGGYQRYAHAMRDGGQATQELAHATQDIPPAMERFGTSAGHAVTNTHDLSEAQRSAGQEVTNLSGHLSTLESRYHLTQIQAYDLVDASKASKTALAESGSAADKAMQKIQNYGNANANAQGPVGQMNHDMNIFGNDALTAADRTSALDDAFNRLVGNFSNSQQAMLQVEQGFITLASNAKQSGASMTGTNQASVTLQQSFYQQIQTIESVAQAMVTQGDSTQQVTGYINDQTQKLTTYAGTSNTAQQAVQGLKTWEDNLHDSTGKASQALQQASETLQNQFIVQLKDAGYSSATTKGDVDNLATAIENTGTKSHATAADRAQLIKDLEASGMQASTAKTDVDHFITALGKVPKNVTAHIAVTGKGVWSVSESAGPSLGIPNPTGNPLGTKPAAAGMMVTGGTAGKDSVLISAMPGELVVPTGMVKAGAVDHLRGAIPGFAGGGVVPGASVTGHSSGTAPGVGSWADSEDTTTNNAVITSVERAMGGAINSKLAGAKAAASAGSGGRMHLSGSGATAEALMRSMAASAGWTGAQWTDLYNVEMREAGFNLNAQNPSSSAYGLAQFINGASEYAQYGGNSSTARGQITGMLNYIKDRYGTPSAAWQHELNFGWYDQGGMLQPGATLATNSTGQPEMILPPSVTQALTSSTGPIAQLTQSLDNPAGGVTGLDKALVNPGGPLAYLQRTIANPGGPMVQLGKAVANPGGPMAKLGKAAADPGGPIAKLGKAVTDPGGPMATVGKGVSSGGTVSNLATALDDADGPMSSLAGALNSYVAAHPGKSGGGSGGGGGHKGGSHDNWDPGGWANRWGGKSGGQDNKSGGGNTLKGRQPAGGDGTNPGGTPVFNINVNYNGTKPSAEDHQAAMIRLSAAIGVA